MNLLLSAKSRQRGFFLLCALSSALVLSGCGDKDEHEFIRGCKSGGGTTAICGCIWDDLKTKYTHGELQKMNHQYGYVPQGFMDNMLNAAQQCRK
ncbi:hypothetical protein [Rouxiella badensis]|uniref:hypothetical protein n=1 Tax=Rouxiella badensis TaxID=1646377 RepID=UPI0022AAAA67|nr:hypothetical protein [Rouxiella badensis]WAT07365.1 hypothetical protein O1V65_13775 [Rouxiella badensis]